LKQFPYTKLCTLLVSGGTRRDAKLFKRSASNATRGVRILTARCPTHWGREAAAIVSAGSSLERAARAATTSNAMRPAANAQMRCDVRRNIACTVRCGCAQRGARLHLRPSVARAKRRGTVRSTCLAVALLVILYCAARCRRDVGKRPWPRDARAYLVKCADARQFSGWQLALRARGSNARSHCLLRRRRTAALRCAARASQHEPFAAQG